MNLLIPSQPIEFRTKRPLKVIFPSKEEAYRFVTDFNVGKHSHSLDGLSTAIFVVNDCTLLERQEIHRAYTNFDNRKKQGELNTIVKYKNGMPPKN